MNFIPVDVATTQPQSGGTSYPEGYYLFLIKDATEVKPTQDGSKQFRQYKCEIVMGPGWDQAYKGKQYTDRIQEGEPSWAPRHMELFVAAFGSIEAVRQLGQQYGGRLPAEALAGRYYIAQLVKNDKYTNVLQRIAYTQEAWNGAVGAQGAAPVPGGALVNQAQAAFTVPAAPAPVAPAPAPAPVLAAPPAFAPPAPPAVAAMPGMAPLPPPPPGVPAGH